MVTTSGSGLDRTSRWTMPFGNWTIASPQHGRRRPGSNEKKLRGQIEQLLRDKSHAPLGGLVGVPLVNVLEVNLALKERYQTAEAGGK